MPKRRRTIGDDEDGESQSSVTPKRKRRSMDVIEICQELYDTIRNHKTDEGRLLCETFVRVPKKRTCAEYYDVVTTPMDLMKIQQKIKTDEYEDVDQMTADMELMIANAKAFYKKSSPGYRDACAIWDLFNVTKNELLDPTSSGDLKKDEDLRSQDSDKKDLDQSNEEEESPYEELFSAVMTAADHDGRFLSSMFQLLPSKTRYPEYYKVIHDPVDLKMIATRILNLSYSMLNDLEKDLLLMVKNAKTFNEPGSQIYKDAAQLRKIIVNKKYEIDQRKVMPAKTSERISLIISGGQSTLKTTIRRLPILHTAQAVSSGGGSTSTTTPTTSQPTTSCVSRAKRLAVGQKWSSITAALQYESDADEFGQSQPVSSMIIGGNVPSTPVQSFIPVAQSSASSSCSSFASAPGTNFSFMAGEDGVEGEEAGNDSSPEDADMNPQWQLYETVKNHQAPQGYLLSEPFLRLPSRKLYNDYYREIKHPMSLFKIKTKIKSGGYNSTVEVVDDLNIMFENAKRYNRPDSKLFKDAVKLQKIMQNKARELINSHMKESDSEGEIDDRKKKSKKSINTSPMLVPLKKRMKLLYKTLLDYVDEFNRPLINMFMEKPARKDYPDYYEVIINPMDMKTIDFNIKNDRYTSEDQILTDFRLMFNNCRLYNEEGSQIYRDADTLEKVLNARLRELGPLIDVKPKLIMKRHLDLCEDQMGRGRPPHNEHLYKLRTFFETIKEYTDHRGRKLSTVFQKLPSKNDYPDYYEVIKRPMDLDRIGIKLKCTQYEGLEELLSDVILMFDNACKYNEPDSQIYKDALALQRIALQTKLELNDPEDGVPDVKALVQELLTNIFISVYNHQDEEGRCFSDSLVELAETENNTDIQMPPQKILTLDIIKRNLDRGRYRRLEMFQEEMFEVFERARMVSRTDSQAFEDSVELQSFFIKTRDELTKGGQILQSPALHYTEADLQASVDALRAEKLPNEQLDPEADRSQLGKEEDDDNGEMGSNSLSLRGQTYRIGDFVYVEPREKGMEPHIIHIEKLWKDDQNDPWISGCWFYRPMETFHLANRKFLQQEVFKSDNYNSTPLSQVIGHCFVMFVKDYFKFKPEGLDDKDVYVCESRYSAKAKAFKKIKTSWRIPQGDNVSIVSRLEPLEPVRIPSAFKDGVEKPREDSLDLDDGDLTIIDKPKPNIVCDVESPEEGAVYYEQFTLPTGLTVRVGDCCYVRTEHEKSLIARIDKMWLDKNGNAYFHGPWFVTPQEIYHSTTRLFYKQEVFLSTIEDTNPLLSIVGRCSVLDLKDYSTLRPTEIPEDDVYVCEARYFEAERQIRKFPKGLKKFLLAPDVMEDEVYYFRKPINPQKTEVFSSSVEVKPPGECTPINPDTENEESLDMPPPSIASKEDSNMSSSTPAPAAKKKSMKKLVTGYIMFAGDMRKGVIQANPDRSFGEISRMIGTEWRNLPEGKKTDYEQRAQRQNEELAASLAKEREKEGYDSYPQSPASSQGGGNSNQGTSTPSNPVDENTIYECLWDGCEYQFEEMPDLVDHLLTDAKGHIYQTYPNPKGGPDTEYQCLWLNCARIKRNIPPFPNIQRLLRHCKEVHLKAAARVVLPDSRSKNFIPSRKHTGSPAVSATPTTTITKGLPSYSLSNGSQSPGMMMGSGGNSSYQTSFSNIPYTPVPLHNRNLNKSHQLGANTPANRHSPYIQQQLNIGSTPAIPFQPVKAPDPIFVATPPKPQRLLHSNTYIKYIEGLQSDNKYIGDWDRQLKATIDNTPNFDSQRLPSNWLANGSVNHGNVVNALWALRNYMMRDALSISKIG